MSETHQSLSNRWPFRVLFVVVLSLLLLARIGYGQPQAVEIKQAVLQGSIHIQPVQPQPDDQTGKIQPGTPVKVVVTVENKGPQASPEGQLYVRYAFAKPLDHETTSIIFETEKKPLPSIEPGKQVNIAFDSPHQSPSLLDFVRYDWSMREYQALAVVNQEDHLIGTLAMTFSAYYYPGIKKELPAKIPVEALKP
jgi:hypothetical protein